MGEYVEGKDRNAVNNLYNEVQFEEFLICHYLNQNMPKELRKLGYFFEIQSEEGQFAHHDIQFVQYTKDRKRILKIRIEFEYGKEQYDWDLEIPRNRWHGINLLTRKDYQKNVDLFLKSSPTFSSIFAVDCRNNFVDKNFHNSIDENGSSVNFVTNERKYEIRFNEIEPHLFIIDSKNKKIKNGNICIVENDLKWKLFYHFLWKRFLNGNKRN